MKKYTCKKCHKEEPSPSLPYQWSSIHEESCGVHDSDVVIDKNDYYLCPDCRMVFK